MVYLQKQSSILLQNFKIFFEILTSKKLIVQNKYILWQVILDWVSFEKDTEGRLEHLSELIKNCLPFHQLPEEFIEKFIFNCVLFMTILVEVQQNVKTFVKNASEFN